MQLGRDWLVWYSWRGRYDCLMGWSVEVQDSMFIALLEVWGSSSV
jgi:hypothetical protein